ncbi:hypothetical protein C8C77_12516 [Halanaerobium saccharolyticum]|uniref:Uncharacterized protein n=1 Tax=Halanaerobium saccharolyticum TaxID=43595 RepID=A0A4R7YXE7_9FIRM|nr:hypothetical protein [Halanaerobium saccharolyticum]RAK06297.1 hypothetical protein C7958_12414 [Halanaerobium saccharolyticum]TDW00776.1 hypothetical protein C8C77_12516 [Halanaerobium saccharolyticum]TDX52418.1 hypothetical protein C7956_12416 [Halanaerobium saccharolyticum]
MRREELVKLFEEKVKTERKIPTARDIDQDQKFPSYRKFKKSFGSQRIRQAEELRKIVERYKLKFKIDELFCEDCKFNKFECGNNIEDCKSKGELYIRILKQELKSH